MIPYLHNAEHHFKADKTDRGQEACSGLGKQKLTFPEPRSVQSRKKDLGKHRFAYDFYKGFTKKEQTLAVAVDLEDV